MKICLILYTNLLCKGNKIIIEGNHDMGHNTGIWARSNKLQIYFPPLFLDVAPDHWTSGDEIPNFQAVASIASNGSDLPRMLISKEFK